MFINDSAIFSSVIIDFLVKSHFIDENIHFSSIFINEFSKSMLIHDFCQAFIPFHRFFEWHRCLLVIQWYCHGLLSIFSEWSVSLINDFVFHRFSPIIRSVFSFMFIFLSIHQWISEYRIQSYGRRQENWFSVLRVTLGSYRTPHIFTNLQNFWENERTLLRVLIYNPYKRSHPRSCDGERRNHFTLNLAECCRNEISLCILNQKAPLYW